MSKNIWGWYFLFILLLFSNFSYANGEKSVVTDSVSGNTVLLKNINGKTNITNIATGESILVNGELAGVLTDETYTKMLVKNKQDREEIVNNSDGSVTVSNSYKKEFGVSCPSNFQQLTNKLETHLCYIPKSKNIQIKIDLNTDSEINFFLDVTLVRSRDWWLDFKYTTKTFDIYKDVPILSVIWSKDIVAKKYYYLIFNVDKTSGLNHFVTGDSVMFQ